jgi:hypothetical protein
MAASDPTVSGHAAVAVVFLFKMSGKLCIEKKVPEEMLVQLLALQGRHPTPLLQP